MILDYEIERQVGEYLTQMLEKHTDADTAVEETAKEFNVTNKDVLEAASLEDYVDILIQWKVIPDILNYRFLEIKFKEEWLNSIGSLKEED